MDENNEQQNAPVKTSDEISEEVRKRWNREKKIERGVLLGLGAIILAVAMFCAGWFGRFASLDKRAQSFLWAIETANKNYYKDYDEDEFYQRAFAAFELDPYSCFYTAEEYGAVTDEREGNSSGLGVALSPFETTSTPRVFQAIKNSPAEKAGLKKGMYVLGYSTDGSTFTAGDTEELYAFISERAKAFVENKTSEFYLQCSFEEDGTNAKAILLDFAQYTPAYCSYHDSETSYEFRYSADVLFSKLSGEKLTEATQGAFTKTDNALSGLGANTAYIRLDEFNGNAAEEFRICLEKMNERKRKNLILDLRSNGGGYMDILLEIASHMMKNAPQSRAIVSSAKFKNGSVFEYSSVDNDYYTYFSSDSRVTVLADEYTASASECLIGALVDYGTVSYGDIVLRKDAESGVARSYGKGIMQSHFPDSRGNVLKLTVAEIFWPNGKSIHGKGVTEEDGARAVVSPFVWGETDVLLDEVLKNLKGVTLI